MRRLILKSFQSPGDILMLTAAIRDLHQAHPNQFQTDVRTSADAIFKNNPFITPLPEGSNGVESLMMHYPLIHESNQRPYHFLHGYVQYLEQQLNLRIPLTRFQGDIHLTREEKDAPSPGEDLGVPERFWIIIAGGKFDFTAKWWNPASYQKVVDHFQGQITFVQCGEQGHWHQPLSGVVDLVGKTSLRDFIRLMYHADGVVCPVTFAMHLAAAVEAKPNRPRHRPCVVIAGGREPPHWEAYPQHQFISLVGALPCCAHGGCWKSRCQTVGDGDDKDQRNRCERPIQVAPELSIPKCMDMISPAEVIRRIELYYEGGVLGNGNNHLQERLAVNSATKNGHLPETTIKAVDAETNVLIKFRHGLGDAMQVTTILQHLSHYHPNWHVDVASLVGKHSVFHGLCRQSIILDREDLPKLKYDRVFELDWRECMTCYADYPSTKAERCLHETFGLKPLAKLCTYKINVGDKAKELARRYFEETCKAKMDSNRRFRVVLIHYQGNTSAEQKNLPVELIRRLCDLIIESAFVPVILDWDYRTPLADGKHIFNPDLKTDLWRACGNVTGDAEILAALIDLSSLMIGVDSGPFHVAGALSTPALGIWTGHHPLHYFALADHMTHLIPEQHARLLRGDQKAGELFFKEHYRFQVYHDLWKFLATLVRLRLAPPNDNLTTTPSACINLAPPTDPVAIDLAHNALLLGAVASLKPDQVLELGLGSGYASGAILQALRWNQKGQLTVVDNWHDWQGQEPPHVRQLHDAGANIVSSDEESFVKGCLPNTYDLVVSDADHQRSNLWLDEHLRIVRPEGLLFFHDTANSDFANLANVLAGVQERHLPHFHFTASSRPDERCHRGWLMVQNRKARVAVVTAWDAGNADLAALTQPNKQAYCKRHGYALRSGLMDDCGHWVKLPALMRALPEFDWVVWMDVDLLVMNHAIMLEKFLDPSADLIGSHDAIGWNNGVFFLRNTEWSMSLLKTWAELGRRYDMHPSPEQSALVHLLYREPKDKWKCVGQKAFNSYLYELYSNLDCPEGQYRPGDFLLHLPGLSNERRIEVIQRYLKDVV